MSFKSIKNKLQANRGFTIVELLIVIVVIGILATITLVTYGNVTARANTTSAKAAASAISQKAEIYNSDSGTNRYPVIETELTSAATTATYHVSGVAVSYSATPLTASSPNNSVRVLKCAASGSTQASITTANITGLRIIWFDYSAGTETANPLTVGTTTLCPDAV